MAASYFYKSLVSEAKARNCLQKNKKLLIVRDKAKTIAVLNTSYIYKKKCGLEWWRQKLSIYTQNILFSNYLPFPTKTKAPGQ